MISLIKNRSSCRSFDKTRLVPKELLESILEAAKSAPSSQNNQPWRCHVITGAKLEQLSLHLTSHFDSGAMEKLVKSEPPPYKNRPEKLDSLQTEGISQYANWWFQEKNGVDRNDQTGRNSLYRKNYEFYGATAHIIVTLPGSARGVEGSFLDAGCFIQNVLLAANGVGLGAIPQYSIAANHKLIKRFLFGDDQGNDEIYVAGISIGYPKDEMQGPPRHPVETFVTWHD